MNEELSILFLIDVVPCAITAVTVIAIYVTIVAFIVTLFIANRHCGTSSKNASLVYE